MQFYAEGGSSARRRHQMSKFPPCLIRASAGTGKTYRLSSRYIALLAEGEKPDRILATTFTRKAAFEIQERIFQRLAAAALDRKAAAELESATGCPCSCSKAAEMLVSLIRQQHRLNISTLDSFFFKIAAGFSLELGLMPGWQLAEPQTEPDVLRDALFGVCGRHDTRKIVSILQLMYAGSAQRGVHQRLEGELAALFDAYRSSTPEAWQTIKPPEGLDEKTLKAAAERLRNLPVPKTKAGAENKPWASAVGKDLERIAEGNWEEFIERGIVNAMLDGSSSYCRVPISDEFLSAYRPLIKHAAAFMLGRMKAQTAATYELMQFFESEYNRLRQLRQDLSFEDVKKRLSKAAISGSLGELYYRLDQQIAHLLFDEFQDTSSDEWRVLDPVVTEILSKGEHEFSFFCVGDTKQAIYAWRGGVAEIFDTLEKTWPQLTPEPMEVSRRCSSPVISFVNTVFSRLVENPTLQEEQEGAIAWQKRFGTHSAIDEGKPGYVKCEFLELPEEEDREPMLRRSVVDHVKRLQAEAPSAEIGILVRRNADVAALIYALHSAGIKASEEGGNKLTDSPLVCAFLSLMKFAEHPADLISRYHVHISPLGPIAGLDGCTDEKEALAAAETLRRRFFNDGIGVTIARMAEQISCAGREARRVGQLRELAYAFEEKKTPRLTDFARLVERTGTEDASASRVRVMTIHQAKGLEFDIVIHPLFDPFMVKNQKRSLLIGRENPAKPPRCIIRGATRNSVRLNPELEAIYRADRTQTITEALSVLYVTLTRARTALFVLASAKDAASEGLSYAALLSNATGGRAARFESGNWSGCAALYRGKEKTPGHPALIPERKKPSVKLEAPRIVRRVSASRLAGRDSEYIAEKLSLLSHDARIRGSLVHRFFSMVEWVDKEMPGDEKLRAAAARITDRAVIIEAAIDMFRSAFESENLREVFQLRAQKPEKGASLEVLCEYPFIVTEEKSIYAGSFDRVVLAWKAGKVIGAHLYELKTDDVPPDLIDRKSAFYAPQIEIYRKAASSVFRLSAEDVRGSMVFVPAGEIRKV